MTDRIRHDLIRLRPRADSLYVSQNRTVFATERDGFVRKGSEQIDEPVEPNRRDNLWDPVPGDHGVRGEFGDIARATSAQLFISKNRNWFAIGAAVVFGIAFSAFRRR